jgi:hypothetical protein
MTPGLESAKRRRRSTPPSRVPRGVEGNVSGLCLGGPVIGGGRRRPGPAQGPAPSFRCAGRHHVEAVSFAACPCGPSPTDRRTWPLPHHIAPPEVSQRNPSGCDIGHWPKEPRGLSAPGPAAPSLRRACLELLHRTFAFFPSAPPHVCAGGTTRTTISENRTAAPPSAFRHTLRLGFPAVKFRRCRGCA